MRRPIALLGSLLLPTLLSGCITGQLWREVPHREQVRTTTRTVAASEVRLFQDDDGGALWVTLRFATDESWTRTLRTGHPSGSLLTIFLPQAVGQRVSLQIRHDAMEALPASGWSLTLVVARPGDDRVMTVPLEIGRCEADGAPPRGDRLVLDEVVWTEVRRSTSIDPVAVAWRIGVTPLAVAADLLLAVPLGIVLGVIAVTDPGLLTGG